MKGLLIVLLFSPLALGMEANLAAISKAISDGDATTLGQYFDQSVEISILDKEDVYSKTQAVNAVKSFFAQYKPKSFSQVHQGVSKNSDSQYCIGNLVTESATFRVYIYMKVSGGSTLIQELRFDQE